MSSIYMTLWPVLCAFYVCNVCPKFVFVCLTSLSPPPPPLPPACLFGLCTLLKNLSNYQGNHHLATLITQLARACGVPAVVIRAVDCWQ